MAFDPSETRGANGQWSGGGDLNTLVRSAATKKVAKTTSRPR